MPVGSKILGIARHLRKASREVPDFHCRRIPDDGDTRSPAIRIFERLLRGFDVPHAVRLWNGAIHAPNGQAPTFATGFESYAAYAGDVVPLMKEVGEQVLEKGRTHVDASSLRVDTVLLESFATRLSDLVIEQAKSWGADLIAIGIHGRRGVGRLLLGSDAEQILRMAPVPVLLVRATTTGTTRGQAHRQRQSE